MSNIFKRFIPYNNEIEIINDIYYNDTLLLVTFDDKLNRRGLPFYSDSSVYKRRLIEIDYGISKLLNPKYNNSNFVPLPRNKSINVNKFAYFDNYYARSNQDAGVEGFRILLPSESYNGNYLDFYGKPPIFLLGYNAGINAINLSEEFTIEFSFYSDSIFNTNQNTQVILFCGNKTVGWSIYILNNSLYFKINNNITKIIDINLFNWYHVCIYRDSGVVYFYVNNEFVKQVNNTIVTELTDAQFSIGAQYVIAHPDYNSENDIIEKNQPLLLATAFNGGLSNIRITNLNRYKYNSYDLKISFIEQYVSPKQNVFYNDVIFHYPFVYDLMDYSKYSNHFKNKELWSILLPNVGGLPINKIVYETSNKSLNLNSSWCLEFYLSYIGNKSGYQIVNHNFSNTIGLKNDKENLIENIILQIKTKDLVTLEIGYVYLVGIYGEVFFFLYLKYRTDRNTYFMFNNERYTFISRNGLLVKSYDFFEEEQTKFYVNGFEDRFSNNEFPRPANNDDFIVSLLSDKPLHFAIQKNNSLLNFFINGKFSYSYLILNNLFIDGEYELVIGNENNKPIEFENQYLDFCISGLRWTNNSIYNVSIENNYSYINSLQPLSLDNNVNEQPLFRIISILRSTETQYTDKDEVYWIILLTQEVDSLTLSDFTLTQLNGLTGAFLDRIEADLNDSLVYYVYANTGIGQGELILNFVDRNTLVYKGTNNKVSRYLGELSIVGDSYIVNKLNPTATITSTSSPYVFGEFQIIIKLSISVESLKNIDSNKISFQNCTISRLQIAKDSSLDTFTLKIKPLERGAIYIQCLEGFAKTPSGIPSLASNLFIRIYDSNIVVLQAPLNNIYKEKDISPSNVEFQKLLPNSIVYTNDTYPLGETSSLEVKPLLEQGGLFLKKFSITQVLENFSIINSLDVSWQYEFFYRTTTNTNTLLIAFTYSGLSNYIKIHNNKLIITSNINSTSNILSSMNITNVPNQWNHFAVTYKNNVFRIYWNGIRQYIGKDTLAKPFDCDIYLGYFENNVNFNDFYLSNLRVIIGEPLYNNYSYEIPRLPYDIPLQIQNLTTLIIYCRIFSNNEVSNRAKFGDTITIDFTTIASFDNITVIVNNISKTPINRGYNDYRVSFLVDYTYRDGILPFSIVIPSSFSIPETIIDKTTDNSFVVIDNLPFDVNIQAYGYNVKKRYFDLFINFTKSVDVLTPLMFDNFNCIITNITKIDNFNYKATIRVLSSGIISISIPENAVLDIVGNYNNASNIYSNSFDLEEFSPDPYIDNVIFYLLGDSFNDISMRQLNFDITDVELDYDIAPPGLNSSFKFNGINSRITVDLLEILNDSIDWTIELYLYCKGDISFSLMPPILTGASNITRSSFDLAWTPVTNASSYNVFVSESPSFSFSNKIFRTNQSFIQIGISNQDTTIDDSYISSENNIGIKLNKISPFNLVKLYISDNDIFRNYKTILCDDFYVGSNNGTFKSNNFSIFSVSPNNILPKSILQGIIGNITSPFLYFLPNENTLRYYRNLNYELPAYYEDVEISKWYYVAIVNSSSKKKTYLYVDGELVDNTKSSNISNMLTIGFSLGGLYGNIAGIRITKGIARNIKANNYLPYGYE